MQHIDVNSIYLHVFPTPAVMTAVALASCRPRKSATLEHTICSPQRSMSESLWTPTAYTSCYHTERPPLRCHHSPSTRAWFSQRATWHTLLLGALSSLKSARPGGGKVSLLSSPLAVDESGGSPREWIAAKGAWPPSWTRAVVKLRHEETTNNGIIDTVSCCSSKQAFLMENQSYLKGYPGRYKIELKENVIPVVNPNRRVPEIIKPKLKETLDMLESIGIISKVDKVTDWVHNIVVVEKPDKSFRICLVPYYLNKCLKIESFPIPTVDELSFKLTGKQLYIVIHKKDGFHQIELDEDSKNLSCFITLFGKYRYERLPMGVSSVPEVFQRYNTKIFGDIEGVGIYFDDTIIAAVSEEEHIQILKVVLKRAKEYSVKFNSSKLLYKYLGKIFDADGVRADPENVKSILRLQDPVNKKELLRVLGMINYLAKFIPNIHALTKPLRDLTKNYVEWQWGPEHTAAFQRVKQKISEAPVLKLFENTVPVVRTESEEKYPQIEKEFLVIYFALNKFHQFVYGLELMVQTDHKPIVNIVSKDVHKVTPRLERLLRYNLNIFYMPGTNMWMADLLSRACNNADDKVELDDSVNEVVHRLNTDVSMSEARITQFQEETKKDDMLQLVRWPSSKNNILNEKVKYFWNRRNGIMYAREMFWGDKIIPSSYLRQEIVNLAQAPHFGLSNTVEDTLARCKAYEVYRRVNVKLTLMPHEVPHLQFEKVEVDLCDFGNSSYLVLVDYLTKWVEIVPIVKKSAIEYIAKLKLIFLLVEYLNFYWLIMCHLQAFANSWNFDISTSSPRYPQANGMAEKAVGIAKSILRNTQCSSCDLASASLEYRNLPISELEVSPAQLLMSRNLRTKLSIVTSQLWP
ncbi:hypothetical protein PR048_016534 [Dryococelus australis]|uniref:Uncharacterized protein n=1 Tax=Dryococelus australis TaxID=614101 RepID=A0ABQ9HKK3_9NEOP|nr:hypothetical protein PR048_016534 [Dryococelus australis]